MVVWKVKKIPRKYLERRNCLCKPLRGRRWIRLEADAVCLLSGEYDRMRVCLLSVMDVELLNSNWLRTVARRSLAADVRGRARLPTTFS